MSKLFSAIFFFILFFCSASADLLVGISPKTGTAGTQVLYPSETAEFVVSVFNDSQKTAENIVLRISVEDALLLVKNGNESRQIVETIKQVMPAERKRVFFTVRSGEKLKQNAGILVEYGLNSEFSNSFTASVDIVGSPLRLEIRALRTALKVGDKSSIAVSARNIGRTKLENVLIELVLPAGIIPLTPPMVIPEMNAGDALLDKGFGFELDPAIRGRKPITVRAAFTEGGKLKVLEKRIEVEASDRNLLVTGIITVVAVLVLIAIFTRKEKKEKIRVHE